MAPKKHLGQHFLTSPAYARRIAESVPAAAGDHVLEIGPGRGALSVFLKERFPEFHCVEIDAGAVARLSVKLGAGRHVIHTADALAFDYSLAGFPLHVAGNLPYCIAALIIKKTLLYGSAIRSCTFMVQREVAERIVSKPHRKSNGFLSIFCQYFGAPELLFHVPPGAFFPKPGVCSSVVRLIVDGAMVARLPQQEWGRFFGFVSRGFTRRRKKLANALGRTPQERAACDRALREAGIDPFSRPEDLGTGEWLALCRQWQA